MILPRGLVFLTTIWIFAAWSLCIGIRPPIQPSIASYLPGVRLFLAAIAVGLCVGWPMLRLSERSQHSPIRQVLIDFITLSVLIHVVLWPLRLATSWSPSRMGMIDLFLFAWAAIIAAILAKTISTHSALQRVITMVVILAINLLGPIVSMICVRFNWNDPPQWLDGPVMGVLRETLGGGARPNNLSWQGTLGVCFGAVAAWMVVLLLHMTTSKTSNAHSQTFT